MTTRTVLSIALVLGACTAPPPSTTVDVEAVNALRAQVEIAENAGNADALLALFTDDVVIMPANSPAVVGLAAAREFVPGFFQAFAVSEQFQSQEVVITGDWAFDRGTFTETLTSKTDSLTVTTVGKYLWLLRRSDDGAWKYARITWSPDAPPPRP